MLVSVFACCATDAVSIQSLDVLLELDPRLTRCPGIRGERKNEWHGFVNTGHGRLCHTRFIHLKSSNHHKMECPLLRLLGGDGDAIQAKAERIQNATRAWTKEEAVLPAIFSCLIDCCIAHPVRTPLQAL